MPPNRTTVVLILLSVLASIARADIKIWQSDGAVTTASYNGSTGYWGVTIYPTDAVQSYVIIDSDGTTDKIAQITILNNPDISNNLVFLIIKNNLTGGRSSIQQIDYIRNYDSDTILYLTIKIQGTVGSPASNLPIYISSANHIEIGGDLYNHIIVKDSPATLSYANFRVDGNIYGGGFINNYGGIILAEIGGNVEPFAGSIPTFWSYYDLAELRVTGGFEGRIGTYSASYNAPLDVGEINVGGNFSDSGIEMSLNSLGRLEVGGDLDAEMTMSANAVGGTVINVGGSFIKGDPNNANFIRFPDGAIIEQSIINANNVGGTWDGFIKIGTMVLDYKYNPVSDQLGGGAIGEAPFNFHQRPFNPPAGASRECDPFQNEVKVVGSSETFKTVTISHYGPVFVNGTGPHFRVEFKSVFGYLWEDKTADFKVKLAGGASATTGATAQREIVIRNALGNTTGFKASGKWRIRPLAGKVKCGDIVPGNPDVDYRSTVVAGDLNSSSGTQHGWYAFEVVQQAPSFFMLLQSPAGPTTQDLAEWVNTPYEVNADGNTNSTDFIDLAAIYTGN